MGIPSGGSFGGSSGDSAFSSGGRFDDDSSSRHHHHRDPFYPNSYNDPFYYNNQQRPYRESSSGGSRGGQGCRNPCSVFASFFAFFGSLWMIFGLFKTDQPLMSLNYSRLISANSVFVKEIQIRNLRDPGPVVYTFSQRPALRDSVNYNETHDDFVESYSHKEWRFWLNQGSTIRLSYDIKGFSQDYLVLAFIRGTESLEDWIRAPNTPAKALKWYRIHGSGVKDFVADRDDDYFVAFGNLNRQDMEVTSELNIHSTLYSVKGADKRMALTSDVEAINVPLALFHANSILLTTPSEPQEGVDIWEVAVVYSTRWITYIVIWGVIVAAVVVFCGIEAGGVHIWRRSREELPLLAPQDDQAVPSHATSNSSSVAISTPPGELDERGGSPRDEHQLCTICLDAPKDCFFDPCGHRCTCYVCGQRSYGLGNGKAGQVMKNNRVLGPIEPCQWRGRLFFMTWLAFPLPDIRIRGGNNGLCPICRQPIRAVRKIFDS